MAGLNWLTLVYRVKLQPILNYLSIKNTFLAPTSKVLMAGASSGRQITRSSAADRDDARVAGSTPGPATAP